ncbi:hypothetical protein [Rhodoferax mekongensis]|uniref:Phage protein n=1 Tax=Rhodoferax mekongensis TaxID=3068341 RepID=A0ABZ0B2X1_9BURK|nr:hypothetical protein [Rhodoferax sp. TBRC 17307]WNO06039.1 hypothetical protein RAN89_06310 [Rhodoferax sp. TBRC 17307]
MAKYRKKPVVVEAWQLIEGTVMPDWMLEARRTGVIQPCEGGAIIRTLEDGPNGEAKHVASMGDWIIKGVKGELYPCKPEIFALAYEVAE